MKRCSLIFFASCFFVQALSADISDPTFAPEEFNPELPQVEEEQNEGGGNIIEAHVDTVGRAKITKKPFKGEHFTYTDFDISYTRVVYYNPCKKEGIFAQVGYEYDNLDWSKNPYFHQKNFNTVAFGLGFFSKRSENWDYKGSINVNFDAERSDIAGYATFDYLLWARYSWCRDIGFHLGVLGLSGYKVDRVLPILGFDWKINESWLVNVIFPVDFKILWKWNDRWSFALASRFWDSLHRAGTHEPLPRAVWEYRSFGFEGAVNYNYKWLTANLHVGYNCGGTLRISNKHTRRTKKIDFDGAPYAGAEVSLKF